MGRSPLKADIASLPRACPFTAKVKDMHCNERSILFDHVAGARGQAEREVMPRVSRASIRAFRP